MFLRQMKLLLILIFLISCACNNGSKSNIKGDISFKDNFENGAGLWDFVNPEKIQIVASGDPDHGKVLSLHSGGEAVYALIKDSHGWTNIRVQGEVFFPDGSFYHYLGLIYNHNVKGTRTDFGSIFLLGPYGDPFEVYYKTYRRYLENPPDKFLGNVILVNPHRDSNASRLLYTEYWVTLKDDEAVKPGEWHQFKAEILGSKCHFYVGDMNTPKVTYDYFEYDSGRVGFKPRFVGTPIWLDNITVTSITELSYKGPGLPAGRNYKPGTLLTDWQVIGPFSKRIKEIEEEGFTAGKSYRVFNKDFKWQDFTADGRGCVVGGKLFSRTCGRWLAYFHREIQSEKEKKITLGFSSTNPLVLWVNNTPAGEMKGQFTAWYDCRENPAHKGEEIEIALNPGTNHIVVLVKGGRYGGDGFFAYCKEDEKK